MDKQKTHYISTIFGTVDVDWEFYREYRRPEERERKRQARQKRCRAEHGNRCKEDCGPCPHDRTGTPISTDALLESGKEPAAAGADPAEIFETKSMYAALHAAINQLPPRDGKIVRMLDFQNWTQRDVAEEVGLSQRGVSYVYYEAKKELSELMKYWR